MGNGFSNYTGSIRMLAGLKPDADGYPLMQTCDIQAAEDGTRLNDYLAQLAKGGGVQANYNVNDDSDPAYIHNRPFFETTGEITLEKREGDPNFTEDNGNGYSRYYKVSSATMDIETFRAAKLFVRISKDGNIVEEVEQPLSDFESVEEYEGGIFAEVIWIVTDFVACAKATNIPFRSNGIYFLEHECQYSSGMIEIIECIKFEYFGTFIKTLENKYLDLSSNEDFQTVMSLAKGATQAIVFETYPEMIDYFNSLHEDKHSIGQNVMITDLEVPDLWISGIEKGMMMYTYVDDQEIVDKLKSPRIGIRVGRYILSPLETLKVDLNNYVDNEDIATDTTGGVIKIGYSPDDKDDKNYAVQVDGEGRAFVNVPWSSLEFTGGIINNLTSNDISAPLSANQGRVLNEKITAFEDGSLEFFSTDGSTGLQYYIGDTSVSCTSRGACTDSDVRIGSIVKGLPVTDIGSMAMFENEYMESVTIPDSIKTIGGMAFNGCIRLKNVYITDVAAWCNISFLDADATSRPLYYATNLYLNGEHITNLVIPDGVAKIPAYAFRSRGIKSAIVPNTVESIERHAFFGCADLEEITLPFIGASKDDANNSHFGYIFGSDSIVDNGLRIPPKLKKVVINGAITTVGSGAFTDCYGIESITLPNTVTGINPSAFRNCSRLKRITIPKNVGYIGGAAFYGCSALKSVFYEGTAAEWNAINIGDNNDKLTNATIYYYSDTKPDVEGCWWRYVDGVPTVWTSVGLSYTINADGQSVSVEGLGSCEDAHIVIPSVYNGLLVTSISKNAFHEYQNLISITIPDSVTSIGDNAFFCCYNLASVNIGNSVTSIGNNAFFNCIALTGIVIPDSVISIGNSAFGTCEGLTSIVIPDSVISIGNYAFQRCSSLTSVTIGNSVTSIGDYAFYRCNAIEDVFYKRSEANWSKVSIGTNNEGLIDATIHYINEV